MMKEKEDGFVMERKESEDERVVGGSRNEE